MNQQTASLKYHRLGSWFGSVTSARVESCAYPRFHTEPVYLDTYYLLEAEIAMAQKRPKEALGFLDKAGYSAWALSPFDWRTKAAAKEALALYKPDAEKYKRFLGQVETGQYFSGDSIWCYYELSMVDYNLGRIAEKTGDLAAAKDHYQQFLEGMSAADPGLPELADPQKRLAALK